MPDIEETTEQPAFPAFPGDLVRDRLLAALRADLLGPEDEREVLLQSPKTRYLVGMLAPRGTPVDAVEDDQDVAPDEGEGSGVQLPVSASLEASAIGLSVLVDASVESITATATWGDYHKVTAVVEEEVDPEDALDLDRDADPDATLTKAKEITEWHREPQEFSVTIPIGRTEGQHVEFEQKQHDVSIHALVRRLGDARVVSVFLDNLREAPLGTRPKDEDYLFQPRLELSGNGAIFLPRRRLKEGLDPDPDIASADLVYRNHLEFGVGHGVASAWPETSQDRVAAVFTEVIPSHEVPVVTPRESDSLSMDFFADADLAGAKQRLSAFLDDYGDWLGNREADLATIDRPLRDVGVDHLQLAGESLERMRSGVDALDDVQVFEAFRFANRAMALQRRHTVRVRAKRRGEDVSPHDEITANWRPFQLGFILQALAGLADPGHPDRRVADLLWFPTGGGKTEAYLGLTAFIIAFRRLRADDDFDSRAGTTVIMRYTLRLLTIQQFQRALTLITACEHLRTLGPGTWGDERFTIGLWVGQSVTPNSYADAKTALNKLKQDRQVFDKSPYQVLFCPWCGDDLEPQHYVSDDEDTRTYIKCWNTECDFHSAKVEQGLPALVVDEEIYHNPPSLLLATVDKFAQMTWNPKIQALFGRVDRHCDRHGWLPASEDHPTRHQASGWFDEVIVTKVDRPLAPPDLIIQDELHLISGPLGTLVGLYESVVDALCTRKTADGPVRPKVVASTATVRRASSQVRSLFDREVAVFPPLALDANDSYFAEESDEQPGRLYVGVFGPGKSIKTTLVRTYGALLGRALVEHRADPSAESDSLMTLVGYFNSLRELGGAVRLVEDDVRGRLRTLKRRGFSDDRILYETKELTSRKGSSRISDTLDALERTHLERQHGAYPVDVLLSSNMISVGVDIDRLGLMVVSGQPKTTAEYIQATSRVGRAHPGLVVQVYNWVRPRDISHYEQFHHYHDTFYRHVEATSVTPFSERARDRALPAVLVAHARIDDPNLGREGFAAQFDATDAGVEAFGEFIVERARNVARHGDDVAEELEKQVEKLSFDWDQLAKNPDGLVYSWRGLPESPPEPGVLLRPMEIEHSKGHWQASGSLREVEGDVPIVLKETSAGGDV